MSIAWPTGILDPHIHQWDPYTTPREISTMARLLRRVPRIPLAAARLVPQADREFIRDPQHVLKPYLPADYRRDAGEAPVTSVIHIEAAWQGDPVDETRWVIGLPWGRDGAPDLAAVVVRADPRDADVGAQLDRHLAVTDRVRGVRRSATHHPDKGVRNFSDDPHLLRDPAFLRGFRAIAERGLSFEIWTFAHELPDAVVLVEEYPETTFVLDHYATPVGLFGPRGRATGRTDRERADLLARWRDDVAAIAAHVNVVAKHSGLGMPMLGGNPSVPITPATVRQIVDRSAPLVQHVQDVFGEQRTMWASNFPMDKPVQSIPASIALLVEILGPDTDLDLLLRDVARRTYRL